MRWDPKNHEQRLQLAERLRAERLPAEKARDKAKNATTEEIVHRLSTPDLSPPVTDVEMIAYMQEAEIRLKD